MKRIFEKMTLFDLVTIAMMAALGIAVKVVLVPLVHIITGPLFIPGGAVSGGIYMLFIVLAALLVRKTGAAVLVCLVQTILVIITGTMGSHGIMSIVTYLLPGIGVEILYLLTGKYRYSKGACFGAGVIANVLGSFGVNFVFFRLPLIPLLLTLSLASLSGGLGGLLAYAISLQLKSFGYFKEKEIQDTEDIRLSGDPQNNPPESDHH